MSRDPNQRRYSLKEPCSTCPFRTDVPPFLHPERAQELKEHLRGGDEFWCHKTVDYSDEEGLRVNRTRACAGARATLANEGRTTTLLQITERLSAEPVADLNPDLPVYDSLDEWVEAHSEA